MPFEATAWRRALRDETERALDRVVKESIARMRAALLHELDHVLCGRAH